MANSAQMIITRWGEAQSVSLSSPDLPGIVAAFDRDPSPSEIMQIAIAAGLSEDGEFQVHIEETLTVEDVQYFVRARHDFRADSRLAVVDRVLHEISTNKEFRDHATKDNLDDVIIIAALPADTIAATIQSASPRQPVNVASVSPVTEHLSCVAIVRDAAEVSGPSLDELGLGPDSPVEKLLQMEHEIRLSHDHELIQYC
ncbi:hypothetical protein QF038_001599 [Pseudarthrobacter sp. W1I19]|uniref:hypothetical protein n=1 Tax=Pseudarthrobacter sp. W1I19 TaxID=3042288 RepID=UPI00277F85B4|nr:hypothetical protein [Pseudarthrobacter sp. W1I19]MDQ0923091.1 hypothetical protein [Pseudarthrobacter sp. W1I19]